MPMDRNQLANIDLNLLVILDLLLKERNVTRAAARLGISQSAMSHALRRLRSMFEDQLLVSTPRGMVPTERALALVDLVEQTLANIESILSSRSRFDPATARRKFTLIASDGIQFLMLPRLLSHLSQHAPGIDLSFRILKGNLALQLQNEIDIAIGPFDSILESGYRQELFHEQFACILRKGHPHVGETLSLEEFTSMPHALVAPKQLNDSGLVDEMLSKLGKTRRIALCIPHFMVAPGAIVSSDLILTLSARLARAFAEIYPLRVLPAPLEIPGYTISQHWHERWHRDPAHVWLRGVLAELFQQPSTGADK
jgi:DNA-binding transcriptional LysR family regulator